MLAALPEFEAQCVARCPRASSSSSSSSAAAAQPRPPSPEASGRPEDDVDDTSGSETSPRSYLRELCEAAPVASSSRVLLPARASSSSGHQVLYECKCFGCQSTDPLCRLGAQAAAPPTRTYARMSTGGRAPARRPRMRSATPSSTTSSPVSPRLSHSQYYVSFTRARSPDHLAPCQPSPFPSPSFVGDHAAPVASSSHRPGQPHAPQYHPSPSGPSPAPKAGGPRRRCCGRQQPGAHAPRGFIKPPRA